MVFMIFKFNDLIAKQQELKAKANDFRQTWCVGRQTHEKTKIWD